MIEAAKTTRTPHSKVGGLVSLARRLHAEPLRLTAAIAGYWWTSNLVIGLFLSHDFGTSTVQGADVQVWFIPISVNGWHALAHGVGGIAGLVAATRASWSAAYVGLSAAMYLAWGTAGLVGDQGTLWLFYGDTFGNWVHLAEGAILGIVLTAVAMRAQGR